MKEDFESSADQRTYYAWLMPFKTIYQIKDKPLELPVGVNDIQLEDIDNSGRNQHESDDQDSSSLVTETEEESQDQPH